MRRLPPPAFCRPRLPPLRRPQVLASEYEAQKAVAPFLHTPVLRRIVQTFTNDERGDFGKWATNPRVIEMLREAQRIIDEG